MDIPVHVYYNSKVTTVFLYKKYHTFIALKYNCHPMIFSRGKVRKYQNFVFGDSILDVTYEYVYLGVNFNYNSYTSFIKAIERHMVAIW